MNRNLEYMNSNLEYRAGDGNWIDFKIVNTGSEPIEVFNPGNYQPTEGWESSRESYQIAVLQSFQVLKMILKNSEGSELPQKTIATMADHITELPLVLKPEDELNIPIPVHEFYDLKSGESYFLEVTYGKEGSVFYERTQFKVD